MWKNAAAVLVVAKNGGSNQLTRPKRTFDYDVLLVKRKSGSGFMPNNYVFPGGILDSYDYHKKWINILKQHNVNWKLQAHKNGPKILSTCPDGSLARLAVRIAAIRETFEETGFLICKGYTENISDNDVGYWQEAVSKNANKFLEFCETYKVCPDVCSIYEWSNWITPAVYSPRRYDTIFFLHCSPSKPKIKLDENEVTEYQWFTPSRLPSGIMSMAPPQLYEISRLMNFSCLDKLSSYAHEREPQGVEGWLPVVFKARDGVMTVLPGDELYPAYPESFNKHKILLNEMVNYRFPGAIMNRVERSLDGSYNVVCNINLKFGQVKPTAIKQELF